MRSRKERHCAWCFQPLPDTGANGRRKYCSQSCRQRSYEQRRGVSGRPIPVEAVVLTPKAAEELRDNLFELRCSAEDIATAAREGASNAELITLCQELVELAKSIEKLR